VTEVDPAKTVDLIWGFASSTRNVCVWSHEAILQVAEMRRACLLTSQQNANLYDTNVHEFLFTAMIQQDKHNSFYSLLSH
jgi:hypothetical protein